MRASRAIITLLLALISNLLSGQILESNYKSARKGTRMDTSLYMFSTRNSAILHENIISRSLPIISDTSGMSVQHGIEELKAEVANLNRRQQVRRFLDSLIRSSTTLSTTARIDSLQRSNDTLVKINSELTTRYQALQTKYDIAQKISVVKQHKASLALASKNDSSNRAKLEDLQFVVLRAIELFDKFYLQIDTSKFISKPVEYIDSVSDIKARGQIFDRRISTLEEKNASYDNLYTQIFNAFNKPDAEVDTNTTRLVDSLITLQSQVTQQLDTIGQRFKNLEQKWNRIVGLYIKTKETKKTEVSALPFLNTIPGLRDYSGNLNIIGSNNPENRQGLYIEFGAYTGILKGVDSSNPYNLFIHDVSNYGFYFKGNVGIAPQINPNYKKLAFNLGGFYLNKPISKDTLKGMVNNFNTSIFQVRSGLEFAIFERLMSAYVNVNAIAFVTNKGSLRQKFGLTKDIVTFSDFGFRFLLVPSANMKVSESIRLYFDLNFLINTKDLKIFNTTSDDPLIPNFRIGLRTDLGFL